ncbi:uncharacterized protein N7479_007341 [Penicillium vulpinum]|uniref:Uncharacterized protein n=1 Tax=Penicillium vulpinum TaxID=29845 RepID=A0A1V6S070_9EURO|nr:uncharacterized protein N7479_007341 [Penicillium vulpinum]KAJ5960191.1 hypothetical protein N7479_007341 [Penicillium vulpinum]OQE07415.1 hypothetical protein PENVUL_c013G00182 [Penicillium vulpinum]
MYIQKKAQDEKTNKNIIFIICAVSIIFVVAIGVGTYFLCRQLRQRHCEPKYLPGKYLKQKWKEWSPGRASYGQVENSNGQDTSYRGAGTAPEMQTNDGVRRDTSIRSIMTLPPYSPSPKPTEQVIAREGERGGMDIVMEYPETVEEQETRREEQMESMYQIRLQRRQELADREARRRERREAQSRGDFARLEQLNAENRARTQGRRAGTNSTASASAILAEHQARERERRIASVSYAELGRVRHDGSRLRADSRNSESHDSDRRPLLQSDAVSSTAPSFEPSGSESRGNSVSSSMNDSNVATELEHLTSTTTHGSSRPVSQTDDGDLGMLNIPPPPDYEHLDWGDAPAYQSPVTEQTEHARQLPTIDRLPSIHVNLPSPMTVSPVTPTQSQFQNINTDEPLSPTERTSGIRIVSAESATTTRTTTRGPPPLPNDSITSETSH